ncbi:MAG: LarC family nickel insertion protein, partial [Limisphaerales bacterium]
MKTLYLDIFSGISGDVFIGAMLDLGVDFHQLQHALEKLGLGGYHLHAARQQRSNIEGIKFDVHLENHHHHEHTQARDTTDSHESHQPEHSHSHHHKHEAYDEHEHSHSHEAESEHGRHFAEIKKLISESTLSEWIKQKAISVFYRVAVAEGKIHGHPPNDVHFHEVGAVDSIIDIVGACLCLEMLGQPRVLAANVVEGTGWVDCAHGRFPVPTTATLEILGARRIAVTQCAEPHELGTPTGAALLAEFAETFG